MRGETRKSKLSALVKLIWAVVTGTCSGEVLQRTITPLENTETDLPKPVPKLPTPMIQKCIGLAQPLPDYAAGPANWDDVGRGRILARGLGYDGPIVWGIPKGFSLRFDAPLSGHCYDDLGYMQWWKISEEITEECLVLWVPMLLPDSTRASYSEQLTLLEDTLQRYRLSKQRFMGLGSAVLLMNLILSFRKLTGYRIPLEGASVRTDSLANGRRLCLGVHGRDGLHCYYGCEDDRRHFKVGAFPTALLQKGE